MLVTRRGEPSMTRIEPLEKHQDLLNSKMTVERLKTLAQKMQLGKFDWEEWKSGLVHRFGHQ